MNSRAYKVIFVLLSFSLLVILLLQGFWIRNFYIQKADEFDRIVYQLLFDVSAKLNERENIHFIKQSAGLKTKSPKKSNNVKVVVSSSASVRNINSIAGVDVLQGLEIDTTLDRNNQVIISDSAVSINNGHQTIVVNKRVSRGMPKKQELDKLMDKMMMEIQTIDVSPIEDIKPDSLKSMINKELTSKGISIPFEFQLRKQDKNTDKIFVRSEGFKETEKTYKADLSNKRIFSDHNYLYLQFPGEEDYLFASMKNILLLSALFSLLIITIFYLTLNTILKQKRISEIKNDFINNMTHELKTPIATTSLAIDAISNPQVKNDHERFNQYTAILKEENRKLNNHVERVLQMAMIDKGNLQLHKKRVDLAAIINSSINTHKLQAEHCNGQLLFNGTQTPAFVIGDEFHLLAAFNNLLDNALKYSTGNCLVHISLHKTGTNFIITIKDNGIGIDAGHQEKVFEKFYRVQGGNLHDVKGFGLGLSYVKSIIESHNGSIELQSEKGKGSTFTVKFPANET
jgi:signal transduction histidine kinase